MPQPDLDLATVQEVERELGVAVGSLLGDALAHVEEIIASLSQQAESYLGRGPLRYRSVTGLVEHYDDERLYLMVHPFRALTSITLFDGATALEQIDIIDAFHEGSGVINLGRCLWGDRGWVSGPRWYRPGFPPPPDVSVTYDAGWWLPSQGDKPVLSPPIEDLPRDIRRAVVVSAAMQHASRGRDRSITSERLLSAGVSYGRAMVLGLEEFDASAAGSLRSYRSIFIP